MQEWQNSICITFKERSLEEDYIEFAYEGGYGIDKLNLSLYTQLLSRVLSDETALWLLSDGLQSEWFLSFLKISR